MLIGVVIPCYVGHIKMLTELLDSIENQTVKPDKVVVSCSSTNSISVKEYSYPLIIVTTNQKLNAAKNRNIAASQLSDMDLITFIDADDIMHPQRIEILLDIFNKTNCDIVLHNFIVDNNNFQEIVNIDYKINTLERCPSGCLRHKDRNLWNIQPIHHSQSTIKKQIFDIVKYPEEIEYNRREDSIFCNRVLSLDNINHVYVTNQLSCYRQSNTPF